MPRLFAQLRDRALRPLIEQQERTQLTVGSGQARVVRDLPADRLRDAEFGVFSQWGEDGIIQFLLGRVEIDQPSFVEFGVEDYRESNTRFLLQNDHWQGLILDRGRDHVDFVEKSGLRWRHTIDARQAFLNRDNINDVIASAGYSGDVGLLSVDVDGVDYWLLEAIDVISPRILIVEYNSLFGPDAAVTVPYSATFDRRTAHPSALYYGASLGAFAKLADSRGLSLVGCNRSGTNAFFVRTDLLKDLVALSPAQAFVPRQHREARGSGGQLLYTSSLAAQRAMIAGAPLVDV